MAYTPTTWVTGDTVTATKLNKLEQGVANAGGGGGGNLFYEVTTTNFPVSTNIVGGFAYLKKSGNTYAFANMISSFSEATAIYGNQTACWFTNVSVPTLENYYLAYQAGSGVELTAFSGGIESTPVTVNGLNFYIVTGDFSISASGWL